MRNSRVSTSAIYNNLLSSRDNLGAGFLLLIDPDKKPQTDYLATSEAAADCGVDAILVGTSFTLLQELGLRSRT